jgi:hypothetical protein
MNEMESWATNKNAKVMQANFLCLTYNLTLLLEGDREQQGIRNENEYSRRKKRLEDSVQKPKKPKEDIPFFLKIPRKASQRARSFFRC